MGNDLYQGWDLSALCVWREARGEGETGMHAVANCIANTAAKRHISLDEEVMRPLRYSSMTYAPDPQIRVFPSAQDATWLTAKRFAEQARAGTLPDVTNGANLYYAQAMKKPPFWATNGKAKQVATIGGHIFFRE